MKKVITTLITIIVIAALAAGGYATWSWYRLDDLAPPSPMVILDDTIQVEGQTDWTVPLVFGMMQRNFTAVPVNAPVSYTTQLDKMKLTLPEGYENSVNISFNGEQIVTNALEGFEAYTFPANGEYLFDVTLTAPQNEQQPYGQIHYNFSVIVDVPPPPPPDPEVYISTDSVVQGDTIAIELKHIPEDVTPLLETDLKTTELMQMGEGEWLAYIGIADAHEIGEYSVNVKYGDTVKTIPITITAGKFNRQDLTIDTSNPVISEANSNAAYAQYRAKIPPFYKQTDPNLYWRGKFIMPTQGRISSEYGLLRYTNGGTTPRRHAGIDIAIAEGTPIVAPANGKVLFSEYLLNTGNTMVIEHGGGLKTYYFHMVERVVQVGDEVKQGDTIGMVGTTGYSTGPHLHFEVRIGDQNLDPFKFINGTGGCFAEKIKV